MDAQPIKKIQAEAFQLVDAGGRLRGELGMSTEDRSVELAFYEPDGGRRAKVGIDEAGRARLELFDAAGQRKMFLGASAAGDTGLALYDEQGHVRAELSIDATDLLTLAMRNADRRTQILVRLDGNVPAIILTDRDGQHRVLLQIQKDKRVGLAFFGEKGDGHFVVGVDEDNEPWLELHDKHGCGTRTMIVLENGQPKLVFRADSPASDGKTS
ncbi:MAG: hypothetical protein JWO45_211 [Spartobacteria bacterium]|nr:hypothetical protein [Spartobacteria bacterium]